MQKRIILSKNAHIKTQVETTDQQVGMHECILKILSEFFPICSTLFVHLPTTTHTKMVSAG